MRLVCHPERVSRHRYPHNQSQSFKSLNLRDNQNDIFTLKGSIQTFE